MGQCVPDVTCAYPFWYILVYSLSDPLKATAGVFFWPVDFTLDNYRKVLTLKGIPRATLISVSVTVICTLEQMFISGFLGYLLSRERMPFRKVIYRFFIGTMFVGGGLIPNFLLRKYLGLYDTYLIYIMPGVSAYNMILAKTFIESIPGSLEESAKLDGASYWKILTRIILPLSKPILATIGVFTAVGAWSDYSTTLIYTVSKDLRTLQYILYAAPVDAYVHQDDPAGGDGCSDSMCLSVYAEVFYQGNHARIRQRMRFRYRYHVEFCQILNHTWKTGKMKEGGGLQGQTIDG